MSETEPRLEPTAGACILAVDDSLTMRRRLTNLLEAGGFVVESAASGEEAFERCLTERFDVVVTDDAMGALSGVQLARLLGSDELTRDTPVILTSAADNPRIRFWGNHAGAYAYVSKADLVDRIVPTVREALANRSGNPPAANAFKTRTAPNAQERLCGLLDDLLFRAVVANAVRRIVDKAQDRAQFSRELLHLASVFTEYGHLCLRLGRDGDETYAIHPSDGWPHNPSVPDLATLGLPEHLLYSMTDRRKQIGNSIAPAAIVKKDLYVYLPPDVMIPTVDKVFAGDSITLPIEVGSERLGTLTAFAGRKRLSARDTETLKVIGEALGLVTKTVLLAEQTRLMAFTDALTGLDNRRRCAERLQLELERTRRYHLPLAILIADLDKFKNVNDTYGHSVGDEVLKTVAEILRKTLRTVDAIGRWGGEEFLVALPNIPEADAMVAAERLRRAVESAPGIPGGPEKVTMSFGMAVFKGDKTSEAIVERADQALYRAKENGRNRVETG